MPQQKILLDTNSYFRLARSIHPLLFREFGEARHCLYVLPELEKEFSKNAALQTKFAWAMEEEYRTNRLPHPTLAKKQKAEVSMAFDFLWEHVQTSLPGPSRIDATYLAYGYVLKIPVVTDDGDMSALARAFKIEVWRSLELLALMVECGHVSLAKVREIVAGWRYWDDMPSKVHSDLARLFPKLDT